MKVFEKSICLAMILAVLFSFTGFAAQCEDIPEHVLRLHVLANSDSQEDQTLKLQVRDRILQESAGMLDGVRNKEEAEQRIPGNAPGVAARRRRRNRTARLYLSGYRGAGTNLLPHQRI